LCFSCCWRGLQAIPQEPYEAALIDGSSRWQTFWHVTLPLLKPSILIVLLLLRTMDLLRVFDQIFILTEGGPGFATETISLYIYRSGVSVFRFWLCGGDVVCAAGADERDQRDLHQVSAG
jgi:multiple sugar transport system permease protein